jgi:hypothetical protein
VKRAAKPSNGLTLARNRMVAMDAIVEAGGSRGGQARADG